MAIPDEFDYSKLRAHVRAAHTSMVRRGMARSNADLARQHANEHHRFHCSHTHEEDNAGRLIGPGSDRRRPSGWYTGQGVIERESK